MTKQLAQEGNFKLSSNRVDELFIPTVINLLKWMKNPNIQQWCSNRISFVDVNVSSHLVPTLGFEARKSAACSSPYYNEI